MSQITGGSVKVAFPSNYQAGQRGTEVVLQFSITENAAFEEQQQWLDLTGQMALSKAAELQRAIPGSGSLMEPSHSAVGAASSQSTAPVAETTAASKRTRTRREPTEPAHAGGSDVVRTVAEVADTSASTQVEGPTHAAPIGQPPVPQNGAQSAGFVLHSLQPTTGTAALPGGEVVPPTNGGAGPVVFVTPSAPQPASAAASSSLVGEISNGEMSKRSLGEAARIDALPGMKGKGFEVLRRIQTKYCPPPAQLANMPQDARVEFLAALAAFNGD